MREQDLPVLETYALALADAATKTGRLDQTFEEAKGLLEILKELPRLRFFHGFLRVLPKPARDFLYRVIAKNRYRIFGKKNQCMIPTEDVLDRFL